MTRDGGTADGPWFPCSPTMTPLRGKSATARELARLERRVAQAPRSHSRYSSIDTILIARKLLASCLASRAGVVGLSENAAMSASGQIPGVAEPVWRSTFPHTNVPCRQAAPDG
jgi:hypothetical protein